MQSEQCTRRLSGSIAAVFATTAVAGRRDCVCDDGGVPTEQSQIFEIQTLQRSQKVFFQREITPLAVTPCTSYYVAVTCVTLCFFPLSF